MLQRRELVVGKGYVNEAADLLCEINAVINRWTVLYSSYDLKTGRLTKSPLQRGDKHKLVHWADREATPEEMKCIEFSEKEALFKRQAPPQTELRHTSQVEAALTSARLTTFNQ